MLPIERSQMISCALCKEPACSAGCPKGVDCGGILRSVWFLNSMDAAYHFPENGPCLACDAPCEKACVISGEVKIRDMMNRVSELKDELQAEMEKRGIPPFSEDQDCLKTEICGIPLENPFLLSSSVVASTYEMCARAFEAGWAGAAFKTICMMDIHEASPRFSAIKGDHGEIIGFKNIEQLSDHSVEENMEVFRRLKEAYPTKFILASIMGRDEAEWEYLARQCEANGADAIELNFSCPNMAEGGLGSDVGQVPELVEKFTRAAKRGCRIPVLAKLTPNVATMTPAVDAALKGGADGIAAINTIKSVTDVDLDSFVSSPEVNGKSALGGYSGPAVKPIALRFMVELGHHPGMQEKHISGMGGIECWNDAAQFIVLGAGSVQVTTAVMKYGYRIIEDLKKGLALYMHGKGFESVSQMRGKGLPFVYESTDALERDTVVYPAFDQSKCIGCGRCVISCSDGGHQALELKADRTIAFHPKKCVGCHLCLLVCPRNAIGQNPHRILPKHS